jgi:opacity protein-like surface antigen
MLEKPRYSAFVQTLGADLHVWLTFGTILAGTGISYRFSSLEIPDLRTLTLRSIAFFSFLALLLPVCSFAQAGPSAYVRGHSLYVGGEFSLFNSDYFGDNQSLNQPAFSIYGDYLVWNGPWPVSLDVNFTKVPDHYGTQDRRLSSLMIGPMIGRHFGRLEPFAKIGAGMGHLTANGIQNYRQLGEHFGIGIGGGLDYRLTNRITLRPVDFTYERWNFSPTALSPQILGFGVSYRIH